MHSRWWVAWYSNNNVLLKRHNWVVVYFSKHLSKRFHMLDRCTHHSMDFQVGLERYLAEVTELEDIHRCIFDGLCKRTRKRIQWKLRNILQEKERKTVKIKMCMEMSIQCFLFSGTKVIHWFGCIRCAFGVHVNISAKTHGVYFTRFVWTQVF